MMADHFFTPNTIELDKKIESKSVHDQGGGESATQSAPSPKKALFAVSPSHLNGAGEWGCRRSAERPK